jgi:hypothetical protein
MTVTAVSIRPSGDRKVSSCIRRQGSKDKVVLQNAYGLPAGLSCPNRTEFCESCYAEALETQWSSVSRLVMGNWEAHQAAGDDVAAHFRLLDDMMQRYTLQFQKLRAAGRVMDDENIFRIHWDGDLFNKAYTLAWQGIVTKYWNVQFWIYTRSFQWAPLLLASNNIAVYLSVDKYNVDAAIPYLRKYKRLLAAFCAETQQECAELAEYAGRKAAPCPENTGRIPLVMHKSGRRTIVPAVGEDAVGACAACRLCVDGVRDVAFATSKR